MPATAHTEFARAIEDVVADERAPSRIDRQVLAHVQLHDEQREHLRRRIGFYLSDMHLKLRPAPELLPLVRG